MNAKERRARAVTHYAQLARLSKALSSPVRLRLIDLLRQGPRGVEALAAEANESVANTSQHLQQLARALVVARDKDGQRVVYRLATPSVSTLFAALRSVAEDLLPELDRLRTDLEVPDAASRAALLEKIRADKVTLLDVRPVEEFRAGHFPGAISIPLEELPRRLHEIPKKKELVAYCRGPYCPLAVEAVAILKAAGMRATHLDLGPADTGGRRPVLRVITQDSGAQPEKAPKKS